MAILYGISGKATGKKGDTVFAVRNGQQIMRQYNPIVSNPNTDGQIAARARLKLLSQLSAIVGSYIAIPRIGPKSPRNQFSQINYPLSHYNGAKAECELNKLQLTKSHLALPAVVATRDSGSGAVDVKIAEDRSEDLDGVIYVGLGVNADGDIRVFDSVNVDTAGAGGTFEGQLAAARDPGVVLAYGYKKLSAKARFAFESIEGDAATAIASLIVQKSVSTSDLRLTETQGVLMA